ncbi:hypothetical protein C2845_PM09G08830 [Panicum miliaceum]|uniref:Uncharacterized protein n=1 Tax=Panicum miliaceum TaxID=4540 RepID=A0A3L6RYU9_PANMI|nr:hypothetical protein C2845_PM09G08830 [Panicum miliaceum]
MYNFFSRHLGSLDSIHGGRRLHQRGACRRVGVEQSRQQVLPPARAVRVVASARRRVHQQPPGVPGVGAAAVDARARRGGLQRRGAVALVEPVPERVGHRAGHHAGHADHRAVHAGVPAGRHQRRRLGPVRRLVERPRALPRALRGRVAHPRVRRAGAAAAERPVVPAPARAEALHRHVLRREHQRDAARLRGARRGRERRELGQLQALPQRARLVRDLAGQDHPHVPAGAAAAGAVLADGRRGSLGEVEPVDAAPPLCDGRGAGRRRRGGEGEEEVGDDGLLCGREAAVPEDGDGDVAAQHGAVVVREEVRLGLDQERRRWHGRGHGERHH